MLYLKHEKRNLCIKRLSYLNSDNSYYFEELFNDDLITNKKIAKICIYLNITFVVFIILTVIQPIFFLGLIPLFCANMFLHYSNKGLVSFNLNKISEFSKTLNVAEKISKSNNFYHDHFENLKFLKPLLIFNKKNSLCFITWVGCSSWFRKVFLLGLDGVLVKYLVAEPLSSVFYFSYRLKAFRRNAAV